MISVIITTYKRTPDIVLRAVSSVVAQTFGDWELIIVDDSPETWEIRPQIRLAVEKIANEDLRIKYIPHDKNSGACAARNTGIMHAKGEYIAFLDDDDEWVPEKLEKQLDILQKSGDNVALVYCGSVYYY